jgi:hypothetical protein
MKILTSAIARSHIYDPIRADGTAWTNTSVEEAAHHAKAVLTALEHGNLKIVEAS